MNSKSTDELMDILANESSDITEYYEKNGNQLISKNQIIKQCIDNYINSQKTKISLAKFMRKCDIEEHYGYKIYNNPSMFENTNSGRDYYIAIAKGAELTFEELQIFLKQCNCTPLYPKYKRDACIIFGYQHFTTILEINEYLYKNHLHLLTNKKIKD